METIRKENNLSRLSLSIMLVSLLISCSLLIFKDPYYGHDIGFHLSRIQSIADCFSNHTFPALIYPNYFDGYGYANGIFYPDLFLYIPGLMVFLGLDCKLAYHIFVFIINIATLLSMYFCINRICSNKSVSAIISSIYLLSSYRLTDLYIRSALGETLCFVFMPFVVLGLYEILYKDYKKGYYLTIGLTGIMFSHVITIVFCVILVFLAYLIRLISLRKEIKQRTIYLSLYCLIAVGITSCFTLPLIEMMLSDTFMYKVNPATGGFDRTIPFLLSIIEIPTYQDEFFPQGIGLVFIFLLGFFFYIKNKKTYKNIFVSDFLILGFIFLIISTNLFPWRLLSGFAQTIQFPWRFLVCSTACLLFAFAPVLEELFVSPKKEKVLSLVLSGFICFTVLCVTANIFIIHDFKLYEDDIHYSLGGIEYLPADTDPEMIKNRGEICSSNNNISISFTRQGTTFEIEFDNNTYDDTYIEIPLIYYKGYKAKENKKELEVLKGENGIVRVIPNNSSGSIKLYYGFTSIRIAGIVLSVLSVILFFYFQKKNNKLAIPDN